MISISRLREYPHFAPAFAHVHALCWPILWWQLNLLIKLFKDEKHTNILYSVSCWGIVTIRYTGAKTDDYKAPERTFRPLTDASWGSDLPCNIELLTVGEATCAALILPCEAGEVAPKGSEGAFAPTPNTS